MSSSWKPPRGAVLAAVVALAALAATACFNPDTPDCAFLCGAAGECPDGYTCGDDGRCHRLNSAGQPVQCPDELPLIDAAADAPPQADAAIDAADAATDAAPQADAQADTAPQADAQADTAPQADAQADTAPQADAQADTAPQADAQADTAPQADAQADTAPQADAQADAFVNTPPTLTAPVPGTVTAVAGDTVTIVATATDPDTAQTLVFTAPWAGTNLDPYGVRAGSDGAGGAFDSGSATFSLPAGILGRFDVRFTVTDGTASDEALVSVEVAAHPVMLNEVQLPTASPPDPNLEIINTDSTDVDLTGWSLCGSPDVCWSIPAGTTITAGGFLVVHWNQTGTGGAAELYTGVTDPLDGPVQELLLLGSADHTLSRDFRDFVKWGDSSVSFAAQAVYAGQWPDAAANVDLAGFADGNSIARTPGANTESPADWAVAATPTLGGAN